MNAKNKFLNKNGLVHYDEKIKKYIEDKTPQSDWNQNDSTKADYIKNKPVDFTNGGVINGDLAINGDLVVEKGL